MNNRMRTLVALLMTGFVTLLSSCHNEDFWIEPSFIDSGAYAEATDIVPIEMSTFRLDSVMTSGQNLAWVGKHSKPVIGDVCSEAIMRMTDPSSYGWNTKEKYDSITITLIHSGDYQGDTLVPMTINIHRMAQPVRFAEREYAFYNVREFRDSTSIGEFRFRPRPHSRPKLRYRLNDDFGRELFAFIRANNSVNAALAKKNFESFLGGIKLVYGDDTENIMAFKTNEIVISLHTHLNFMEYNRITRTLTVESDSKTGTPLQYNSVWTENTVTPYDKLTERYKQVTEKEGNLHSVMFEGLGYYTRINFPTMDEILSQAEYKHIVKAELYLYPEHGSYDKRNFPNHHYLSVLNKGNVITESVNASVAGGRSIGLLVYNRYDEKDVYYVSDITYYLNKAMEKGYVDRDEGLLVTWNSGMAPTDYNFLLFNGRGKNKYYSYMKLYYYNYDKVDR